MKDNKFLTLGIETSCDETAISVVADGREVLSNVISSQIDIFKNYGGVVPEIASRHHLENINGVLETSLKEAGVTLDDIDLVGVTMGPGLIGALLMGVSTAKAIAFASGKPIVGVHHLIGHVSANFIQHAKLIGRVLGVLHGTVHPFCLYYGNCFIRQQIFRDDPGIDEKCLPAHLNGAGAAAGHAQQCAVREQIAVNLHSGILRYRLVM